MANGKFLFDVHSKGTLVDFPMELINDYFKISQLAFNNILQKFVDASQTL